MTNTPPRIYVTSVDESNRAPAPTPIPSIDLEMSQKDQENSDEVSQKINLFTMQDFPEQETKSKSIKCLENDWPIVSQPLALLIIFFLLWGIAFSILPPELTLPSTALMRIMFLFVGAQICGILVSLTGLPDMLGMLFWGVFYKNIGWGNFDGYGKLEAFLRELALVNIMLLAGLGLDLQSLKKLFGIIMQLTLIPTIAETASITVLAYFLLDMPWLWGVLLGLVVTAVSPNVVVTILLRLKEERLGMNKGIHTLIIAMTSCNDVIAIFLFGVILGVIFSTGSLTSQILQGPIGIVIGIVYGGAIGYLLLLMPSYKSKYTNGLRFTITILSGILSVVGSKMIGYPSAGALGCISIAFVAGTGWKQHLTHNNEVGMYLDLLWKFLKPVSFSLIGKEVDFSVLQANIVLYGSIALLVGVIFRLVSSYLSTFGSDLNWKEKAYVTLSGFPKATVQAALGPIALDMARTQTSEENIYLANIVLIVSVLSIIFTAPLGALLMTKLAPVWLKRSASTTTTIALEG